MHVTFFHCNIFGNVIPQGKPGAPQFNNQNSLSFSVQHRDGGLTGHAQSLQTPLKLKGKMNGLYGISPSNLRILQKHLSHFSISINNHLIVLSTL
jgi:hypothetical protein